MAFSVFGFQELSYAYMSVRGIIRFRKVITERGERVFCYMDDIFTLVK